MKMEWRDKDWFKHASRAKLYQCLNGSRVVPAFAVPRQFQRKRLADRNDFHPYGWAGDPCVTLSNCPLKNCAQTRHIFFSHLKPKAPIAFPNGVEPKPRFNGHPVSAFDGAMSHEAFEKLNAAIGARTLPLKTQVFSLKDVAAAHHGIEEGHVVGKIVLHVDL
jgi:hypothetical protein